MMQAKEKTKNEVFTSSFGFSLVELLVVMSLFVVIMAIGANTFKTLLRQSTQQSKITESQIEKIAGLELLRSDIASAGFGLPWAFQNTVSYSEAATAPNPNPAVYNDSPVSIPRAIISGNNNGNYINGSDYLVLKGTYFGNSTTNTAASKWSYILYGSAAPKSWGSNDLANGVDKVIVVVPQTSETTVRQLVMNGSAFYTTYSKNSFSSYFSPIVSRSMYMIYGVDSTASLRMPFNRVDYFISGNKTLLPQGCAPNTGELVRAYVSQTDGSLTNPALPILDCVADMQVIFNLDMNDDGAPETLYNDNGGQVSTSLGVTASTVRATLSNPALLRQRLREVRIYILTHEGKADTSFSYPNNIITVGDPGVASTFDLSKIGPGWQNYRWKVLTLTVKPKNLY